MPDWGFLGLVLSPVVVVEVIRLTANGLTQRKRAKKEKVTELDIALASRSRWIIHSRRLSHDWWTMPRPDLPDEPKDPWPPSEGDST